MIEGGGYRLLCRRRDWRRSRHSRGAENAIVGDGEVNVGLGAEHRDGRGDIGSAPVGIMDEINSLFQ